MRGGGADIREDGVRAGVIEEGLRWAGVAYGG